MHACLLVMLQVYNKLRQHTRGLLWFLAGMELKTVQKVLSPYYTAYPFTKIQWILANFYQTSESTPSFLDYIRCFVFFRYIIFFVIHLNLQYV
jgi:hypothetical protein